MNFWMSLKRYITLPLVGYIILASATAYAIGDGISNAKNQRIALAIKTADSSRAGCGRTNDLRLTVQGILVSIQTQIDSAVEAGELEESQAQAQKDFYAVQIKKLNPIDCRKAYPLVTK